MKHHLQDTARSLASHEGVGRYMKSCCFQLEFTAGHYRFVLHRLFTTSLFPLPRYQKWKSKPFNTEYGYVWKWKFLNPGRKSCGFKYIRISVGRASKINKERLLRGKWWLTLSYFYMSSDSFVLFGGNILHNPRINCLKSWVRLW